MTLHQEELEICHSDSLIDRILKEFDISSRGGTAMHATEDNIYTQMLELGRKALQKYVDSLEETSEKSAVDAYNQTLPYKKTAEREYLSIFGPIKIKRAYYWKKGCKEGLCPLDKSLNLPEGKFSYALQGMALKLIISEPYREALETIDRIFKIKLWPEAIQAILERASSYANSFYKKIKTYEETEGPVIAVTMDCKGIPMVPSERSPKVKAKEPKARREKGDKRKGLRRDAVVTAHFTFYPESRTPEEMFKALMRQYTKEEKREYALRKKECREGGKPAFREPLGKQVQASMDGKENAFARLADQVLLRNPSEDKPIVVLMDGASSLENRFIEEARKRRWMRRIDACILDVFHATEYLWEAGAALYGEKSYARQGWVEEKLLDILKGKVGYVIGGLKQILKKDTQKLSASKKKVLQKVITYYENHRHMMQYGKYLQKGYPIGTGVIEGACGCLVKDRTDRSGMKWTHEGAQAILNLRAINQNGDWEEYFAYYVKMEQQRLYKSC